jgi:hypothetical protein
MKLHFYLKNTIHRPEIVFLYNLSFFCFSWLLPYETTLRSQAALAGAKGTLSSDFSAKRSAENPQVLDQARANPGARRRKPQAAVAGGKGMSPIIIRMAVLVVQYLVNKPLMASKECFLILVCLIGLTK